MTNYSHYLRGFLGKGCTGVKASLQVEYRGDIAIVSSIDTSEQNCVQVGSQLTSFFKSYPLWIITEEPDLARVISVCYGAPVNILLSSIRKIDQFYVINLFEHLNHHLTIDCLDYVADLTLNQLQIMIDEDWILPYFQSKWI